MMHARECQNSFASNLDNQLGLVAKDKEHCYTVRSFRSSRLGVRRLRHINCATGKATFRIVCAALNCALFCVILQVAALASSTPFVASTDPSYVVIGQQNVLIVYGKGLQGVKGCALEPKHGQSVTIPCSIERIGKSGQIKVTISLGASTVANSATAGQYWLSLTSDAGTAATPPKSPIVLTSLDVVSATAATAPAKGSAGGSPQAGTATTSPYTTCLTVTPGASQPLQSADTGGAKVLCSFSLLTSSEVSDNFGDHVNKIYYALQVQVANKNPQYSFLLQDIIITLPNGQQVSGRIKRFAQGVELKGKSLDRRNIIAHWMQLAGSVYGGLSVFSFATADFKNAGNIYQGPFLGGLFGTVYPDASVDNVNRFNNAVFDDTAPAIVPRDNIGQPPLYVVALLPKPPGTPKEFQQQFGEHLTVSVEGTYIKQVNLLATSVNSLTFQPAFVVPSGIDKVFASTDAFNEWVNQIPTQPIVIRNDNSAPLTISGITISEPSSATAGGTPAKTETAAAQDFQISNTQGNCGVQDVLHNTWDVSKKFSIPANSSCTLYVRFVPAKLGAVSGILAVNGDFADGNASVTLSGTGVGMFVDTPGLKLNSKLAGKTFSGCTAPDTCSIDLGNLSDWKTMELPLLVFAPAGASGTVQATVQLTGSGFTVTNPLNCLLLQLQISSPVTPSCSLTITPQSPAPASGPIDLRLSVGAKDGTIQAHIVLNYSVTQEAPTIKTQPSSTSVPAGQSADLKVEANGSAPLTYQWYEGNAGDKTKPVVGGNQAEFKTPALTQTTTYWVLVSNAVNTAGTPSAAAQVTVQPATPAPTTPPPAVPTPPSHKNGGI